MRLGVAAAAFVVVATFAGAQDAPTRDQPEPAGDAAPTIGGQQAAPAPAEIAAPLPTGTVAQRYAAGVTAYEASRFEDAAAIFLSLVKEGHADPSILLALGNAAYRRDRFVEAIYAYEWALRVAPADADVAANLAIARAHLLADHIPTGESAAAAKTRDILLRIPARWTAEAFIVLWTLGWLVLALRQRGRLVGRAWIGIGALLLSLPAAAHLAFRIHEARGAERGVLQAGEVDVKSGPGEEYATLFTLHAGTLVEARDERSDWRHVAIPSGPEGWVPAKDLAILGKPETLR